MIAIGLSKQQVLDADPKTIQQINFTANLDRKGNTIMFFFIEEAKETVLNFLARNCKSFVNAILLGGLIFIDIKRRNTTV